MEPDARILERIFASCFEAEYRTILEGGGDEPLYVPADSEARPHRVIYREDYFASALHEVAHWCLAGRTRRAKPDYGYWYAPDGRDAQQQAAFERAEARPQALEWIFSDACGFAFTLSADNLEGGFGPSASFRSAVDAARARFGADGLPSRAARFRAALDRARSELAASASADERTAEKRAARAGTGLGSASERRSVRRSAGH